MLEKRNKLILTLSHLRQSLSHRITTPFISHVSLTHKSPPTTLMFSLHLTPTHPLLLFSLYTLEKDEEKKKSWSWHLISITQLYFPHLSQPHSLKKAHTHLTHSPTLTISLCYSETKREKIKPTDISSLSTHKTKNARHSSTHVHLTFFFFKSRRGTFRDSPRDRRRITTISLRFCILFISTAVTSSSYITVKQQPPPVGRHRIPSLPPETPFSSRRAPLKQPYNICRQRRDLNLPTTQPVTAAFLFDHTTNNLRHRQTSSICRYRKAIDTVTS